MNFLQSQKPFLQLLSFEFHEKHYHQNLYPTTILQLECLKLNLNYLKKTDLVSQRIGKKYKYLEKKRCSNTNLRNDPNFIDQKILIVNKTKQVNFDKKNSCDSLKIVNKLSKLTFMFQSKVWISTINNKMPRNSLNSSKEASLTSSFGSCVPFEKPTDRNIEKNYYLFNREWCCTNLKRQISVFYKWMTENAFIIWIKRTHKIFSQLFGSIYAEVLKNKEKFFNISLIRHSTNEYSSNIIEKKITNVIQELQQIREVNEETLSVLKQEIITLQDSNTVLTREVKKMSNVLENISMNFQSIMSQSMKSISVTEFSIPPPPPMPQSPGCFSPPTIPKSTKKTKNSHTTAKRLSITTEKRPVITVEDLLKVTLKKPPPKNEKENERKSEAKHFGPMVTIDMLKKVKLKSINCKSNEYVRLPLRTLKNNEKENQS